jgi:predicted secreted hydrolase
LQRTGSGADEHIRMRALDPGFAFDLRLTPTQPLLLQGENGWPQKGPRPELASHYVSWPQLRVEGQLTLDNTSRTASGRAWFDHEWSSEVLGDAGVGWDWIGINLDDGSALMAFRIRDQAGATVYAHASLRDAAGQLTRFGPQEVGFTPLRHWQSPRNGGRYPIQMEIRIGPHTLRTTPVIDDQEIIARRPLPVSYWEGLVRLDGDLRGRGYLELTGYSARMTL